MPISGLIITLESGTIAGDLALATLSNHSRIELGPGLDSRYPAVLDTPTESENKHLWKWLNTLPGVRFVDVVSVHFDDAIADEFDRETDSIANAQLEHQR